MIAVDTLRGVGLLDAEEEMVSKRHAEADWNLVSTALQT